MNIAVLHYHLQTGGITRVIADHVRALDLTRSSGHSCRIAIIHGDGADVWHDAFEAESGSVELSFEVLAPLGYDEWGVRHGPGLGDALARVFAKHGFEADDTVVHVHNHALGKNASLPGAIAALARRGYRFLLQIHDFAEDFRPANYQHLLSTVGAGGGALPALLYPQATQVHYAVLNGRDHDILLRAGVAPNRLHLLPNAVSCPERQAQRDRARSKLTRLFGLPEARRYVLCPSRGIRRKNLGEALLWSLLVGDDATIAFTLPARSADEKASYERWKRLAATLSLPCLFETGTVRQLDYEENVAAADVLLTTSVAEGFGLAFLEPWLYARALAGRNLPEITADFVAAGLRFPWLRPRMWIPVDWVGRREFVGSFLAAYLKALEGYGVAGVAGPVLERKARTFIDDDLVDFALLPTAQQGLILERCRRSRRDLNWLRSLNSWTQELWTSRQVPDLDQIAGNAQSVKAHFSHAACGQRLWKVYARVAASEASETFASPVHPNAVLDSFLSIERFHPIRVE